MKRIYRNYYEEKESLIRNGFGFLYDKFHQFKLTDCLKNEELNKLNPKVMFFKYKDQNHSNKPKIDKLNNLLINIDEKIVELEFYKRKLNEELIKFNK